MEAEETQPFDMHEHLFNTDEQIPEDDISALRDELLNLSENGEIKYTEKYIRKASSSTLQKIKEQYYRKQLRDTNEAIANVIITKFSDVLERLDMIGSGADVAEELKKKKLLKRDLTRIIGYVTPYIPLIGFIDGGVTVGGHIFTHKVNTFFQSSNEPCNEPE